ncbi:hypothetical protein AVEN_169437-1 [Araneus ventricosus]|uniref:Uncharacterized protein n=1 Tax=Araneus ventricosus TaxID=182803 RepID=A0A4Y2LH62_ARAVE|nr:hypothetical protein AVEN_169437-1 [Araneus ventricosus]
MKATRAGIPTYIPSPRNYTKSLLQKESIIRREKEWDNLETGRSVHNVLPKVKTTPTPWQSPEIMDAYVLVIESKLWDLRIAGSMPCSTEYPSCI